MRRWGGCACVQHSLSGLSVSARSRSLLGPSLAPSGTMQRILGMSRVYLRMQAGCCLLLSLQSLGRRWAARMGTLPSAPAAGLSLCAYPLRRRIKSPQCCLGTRSAGTRTVCVKWDLSSCACAVSAMADMLLCSSLMLRGRAVGLRMGSGKAGCLRGR